MKLVILLSLATALFSCGISNKERKEKKSETITEEVKKATLGDTRVESSPVEISSIVIQDDLMKISVSYSGGCESHSFDLVGSFAAMKSLPPKRIVRLVHNANEDSCREMIEETLEFDITELAVSKNSGSQTILLVEGYKGEVTYTVK